MLTPNRLGFHNPSDQEEWIIVEEVITEDFDGDMGDWGYGSYYIGTHAQKL